MLNKPSCELLAKLSEIEGVNVLTGDAIGADYCHDELPLAASYIPDAVVAADSTEAVSAVLALCNEAAVGVTVRGAGTGQVGGSVACEGGIVLVLAGMNNILGFDADSATLCVQPGVLLQDVKAEADKNGLYYPPDPGEKTATIGGNAATNAAGPCAGKYGTTADYVVDATIVLADGTVAKLSDKPEYKAVIGSEGTLAVITELVLKLVEKPAADVILLFPFMDAETAVAACDKITAAGFNPAVLEFMDTDIVEFSGNVTGNPVFPVEMDGDRVGATLMVTIEGADDDELDTAMESIAELAEELECLDILVADTISMKRDTWTAHDAFHTSMESGAKSSYEYNVKLPSSAICEMLEFAKALAEEKNMKALAYSHAADGGMHIHFASEGDKAAFAAVVDELSAAVYAKVSELGGDIRGEYGIGYAKKAFISAEAAEAHKAAKAALDPNGILNPGKIC